MKKNKRLGFIGAGNMATALIKGLIQSGAYAQDQLQVSDSQAEALKMIADQFDVKCHSSNNELVRESSVVVLAVKPQIMKDVLEGVKEEIRDDHLLISIAAGIPLKTIKDLIGRDIPLIRVMPNTPALVRKGMSALAGGKEANPGHMEIGKRIFDAVGATVEVEEAMMDAVTAISGSGPGYVFRMMECMVNAGAAVGMENETSLNLVIQTFLGAAHMAKESEHSLSMLREMVTSPGGTTAAGLAMFDKMGLENIFGNAVDAAYRRSLELGKE